MRKPKVDLIFEVSWEVCNKVGGIYTVLSSKSHTLQGLYNEKIIFIGPDFGEDHNYSDYFQPDPTLLNDFSSQILPYGVKVRCGRWKVPGTPKAVLVDFRPILELKNEIYGEMWEHFGVDSLHAYGDYDDSCGFSVASAIVIKKIWEHLGSPKKAVALFNEWTTGMGLLYLKTHAPSIATVFTAHATCMGRSICGNNKPLYNYLEGYNGDQMSEELNMQSKHSLEKRAARHADCFTTVSEVTAIESRQLLEKYPDVVTPNGFDKKMVNESVGKKKNPRLSARKKLINVASALTGKKYKKDVLLVATSGRNEYHNKGVDVFLDSINTLRSWNPDKECVAFILVPAWTKEPRTDLQHSLAGKTSVDGNERNLTHWLNNPDWDAIYNRTRQLGLTNNGDSHVDVIYVPCYLNGSDGIFNCHYYGLLPGFDLTVFPSYYEPWGYTPLESIAFGVPTVTTSLSGFGQWVRNTFGEDSFEKTGVEVIRRDDFNYDEVVFKISSLIDKVSRLTNSEFESLRVKSLLTADEAQWESFIKYYLEAFEVALKNNKSNTKTK